MGLKIQYQWNYSDLNWAFQYLTKKAKENKSWAGRFWGILCICMIIWAVKDFILVGFLRGLLLICLAFLVFILYRFWVARKAKIRRQATVFFGTNGVHCKREFFTEENGVAFVSEDGCSRVSYGEMEEVNTDGHNLYFDLTDGHTYFLPLSALTQEEMNQAVGEFTAKTKVSSKTAALKNRA